MELQDWPQSLARQLVDGNEWHRAVSLDVESKILSTKEFLTGERLLGVGIARRFFSRVDTQQFWTEDDSDEKEFLMLEQLGNALSEWRPIALIGYNIAGYDIPILSIKLKQWPETLVYEEMYYSQDLFFIGALDHLSALVRNPFQKVTVESVDVFMEIERTRNLAEIKSASLAQDRVYPGDTVTVNVEVDPFEGPSHIVQATVALPMDAAPGVYKIVVMSGVERGPLSDVPPVNFEQFIRYLGNWAPNNSMVLLTIYPEKAPAVAGEELMEMPTTLRDTMLLGSNYSGVAVIDKQDRKVVPWDTILVGNAVVPVFVEKRQPH